MILGGYLMMRSGAKGAAASEVQKRTLPARDLFDPVKNVVSHHSQRRLRRYRMRRALWFFQVIAFLCLGLAIPYVAKWGYERIVYKNDQHKLARLKIETSGTLSEASIAEAAGVEMGDSLLRLDLKQIQDRISSIPSVRQAEVSRVLPDQLVVRVTERVGVTWLSCPDHDIKPLRDGGLLLDRNGVVFSCRETNDLLSVLPTIEVTGIPRPVEGALVSSSQVVESLKLIEMSQTVFAGKGMDIIDVRALASWGLLCRYSDNLIVTFDINRVEQGLQDLAGIFKKTSESDLSLATVNLVTVKNIPVTFHSESVLEKW